MSIVLRMVKESQTSGGTGNLTGCAAVTGFHRGDTAPGGALDRRYKYWIHDGSLYEFGVGYKSATGTFVRETILGNSSGTTSAINFTTNAEITSQEITDVTPTFPEVYSEDGDGVGLLQTVVSRMFSTSAGIVADRLYCMPVRWMGENPISEIGFDVTAAPASSGTVYMGFYTITSAGEPGEVLSETSAAITTGSSGIVTATISSPVMFRRAFVALITTVAFTPRGATSGDFALPDAQLGSTADVPYAMLYAASASPTALPDPVPTSWTPVQIDITAPWQIAMYGK